MTSRKPTARPLEHVRARLSGSQLLWDVVIALGLAVFGLLNAIGRAPDFGSIDPLGVSLLLLQTLPLVVRRRYPVGVLVVVTFATVAHGIVSTGPTINATLGGLVAVYTVADQRDRRVSVVGLVGVAVSIGALIVGKGGIPAGLSSLVQSELVILIVWLLGSWSRERRQYLDVVEKRALLAEREREAQAERAVAEERARIARELHDVVTHHVSVIVIQAGAALRALDRRPDDARTALEAIDGSGRLALADMRRMLGILGPRAGDPATAEPAAAPDGALAPMPGLDRLGELIERVRAAGLAVEVAIEGEPRPLDPGVELSAYRIVQEALTNSLKHAPGSRARVDVRYEPDAIMVSIADSGGHGGPAPVPAGQGHGLIGMRERVALFGGRLEAGPAGGGFRVSARLPLDEPAGAAGLA